MQKLSVVYPYIKNYSRELEWSIKSLDNIEHGKIFVIGDSPDFILKAINIIPYTYQWAMLSPYNDVINKLLTACNRADITEDFIYMNDDIFLLSKYDGTVYNRGTFEDQIESSPTNSYSVALENTLKHLQSHGYSTLSYETHTPIVFNKKKLMDLIQRIEPALSIGHNLCIRSLYGNVYGIDSEYLEEDTKNPDSWLGKPILSTNEQSFMGAMGHYIMSVLSGVEPEEVKPKYSVSVIIPAYNPEDTIEKCLDSIPDHAAIKEIIVCDDGSDDNTLKLLKKYKRRTIKILTNKENKGVGYTFNRLLDEAKGDYVCRIDADDTFTKDFTKVLDKVDGSDIIYFSMRNNDGTIRPLTYETRMTTVANCKLYRREFVGDQRTIETNWSEDRYIHAQLLKKNPKELYTGIQAYNYNYPRTGSLTDLRKKLVAGKNKDEYTLNLFTNCHKGCLDDPTIFKTFESFGATFGMPKNLEIYCDPNPNKGLYEQYAKKIEKYFGVFPIVTESLSDGYSKSIKNATTPYLFQLEADWRFQNIGHSLQEILGTMKQDRLWFMLFNQHKNVDDPKLAQWQSYLKPHTSLYSKTDRCTNNPHIIEVETYKKKAYPLVDWTVKGAGYIEQALEKKFDVAVYGEYGRDATIKHLDMRRGGEK